MMLRNVCLLQGTICMYRICLHYIVYWMLLVVHCIKLCTVLLNPSAGEMCGCHPNAFALLISGITAATGLFKYVASCEARTTLRFFSGNTLTRSSAKSITLSAPSGLPML